MGFQLKRATWDNCYVRHSLREYWSLFLHCLLSRLYCWTSFLINISNFMQQKHKPYLIMPKNIIFSSSSTSHVFLWVFCLPSVAPPVLLFLFEIVQYPLLYGTEHLLCSWNQRVRLLLSTLMGIFFYWCSLLDCRSVFIQTTFLWLKPTFLEHLWLSGQSTSSNWAALKFQPSVRVSLWKCLLKWSLEAEPYFPSSIILF